MRSSFIRLDVLSPSMARSFRKANDDQRRRVTLEACIFAISQTGLEGEHIGSAIEYLRHGGSYPFAVRRKLEALTAQLDEQYFKLAEEADHVTRDAAVFFRRARAAAAQVYSLSPSSEQLHEAIYEAINACHNMDEAKLLTEKALG
jgi:type II secretory pathway pseudopilin PulG